MLNQTSQNQGQTQNQPMMQQPQAQSQSQQQAQNQIRMAAPPQVITDKDLSYLKDAMSWLLLAMKKCAHFAQECQDAQVRNAIDQVGQMHQRQYMALLKHCQTNNQQGMAAMPSSGQQQ